MVAGALKPTGDQIEAFYNANRDNFSKPELFHAAHIVKHVTHEQSEEQAEAGIQAALAELERGDPFAEVAERHSDCKGNGGDLGKFPAGQMVQEFDEALRPLEPGQRTGIFTTPFGFHIAELRARTSAAPASFEDVRADIERVMTTMNQHEAYLRAVAELRSRADIGWVPDAQAAASRHVSRPLPLLRPQQPAPDSPRAFHPMVRRAVRATAGSLDNMVRLDAARFHMGSESPEAFPTDGEGPVRQVTLSAFYVSRFAVTNEQFAEFARKTGYRTEAEHFGWSFVFRNHLPKWGSAAPAHAMPGAPWWVRVDGADWSHPEGPDTSILTRPHHPAVHISWHDAQAYCAWAGYRLPTEAEWEYAVARRPPPADLSLGRRSHASGPPHVQHLAGSVSRQRSG